MGLRDLSGGWQLPPARVVLKLAPIRRSSLRGMFWLSFRDLHESVADVVIVFPHVWLRYRSC